MCYVIFNGRLYHVIEGISFGNIVDWDTTILCICVATIGSTKQEATQGSSTSTFQQKLQVSLMHPTPFSSQKSLTIMALQQPFLSELLLHSSSIRTTLPKSSLFSLQIPQRFNLYLQNKQIKKQGTSCYAIAENLEAEDRSLILENSSLDELRGQREIVGYDWTEEWYPLYLTKNVPNDAPLGLTVFDKQVVLYKDGSGELRCFEDRCPHR